MRVKAVLFDLGGTLVKPYNPPMILQKLLTIFGVQRSFSEVSCTYSKIEKEMGVDTMMQLGSRYWFEFNLRILENLGVNENKHSLAKKLDKLWWSYVDLEIYPDTLETLAELKRIGIKNGIVTNAFERDFRKPLAKLGLRNLVDTVVGIDTCGYAKPDKEIFLYAIGKLGLQKCQVLFVGDSIEYDYKGARSAGLRALLIARNGEFPKSVDGVRSISEVLPLIEVE